MNPDSDNGTIEDLLGQREWARSLARCLVRGDDAVEDVIQQAYLRAMQYTLPGAARQRQWFGQVIRNVVRRRWQIEERERLRREKACRPEAVHPAADELAEQVELQRRLAEFVLGLQEPYRSVVILRYFEDLLPGEIAERVGAPVETVRTQLKRAIRQLRRRFEDSARRDGQSWRLQALALAAGTPRGPAALPRAARAGSRTLRAGTRALGSWTSPGVSLGLVALLSLMLGGTAIWVLTGNGGRSGGVAGGHGRTVRGHR